MLPGTEGPRVANIELDAIHDEDVRTEAGAQLIDAVLQGKSLQISPVLQSGDTFDHAPATLTFTNDSEFPMVAAGTIARQGALRAAPETFDVTVAPRSSAQLPIELRADAPTPISQLVPLTAKWIATFNRNDQPPLKIPREDVLAVETIQACPTAPKPITVDGNLTDWPELPLRKTSPAGPQDCSYRFGVAHDQRYVYVGVQTTDDHAILNPGKEPWSQDGVEIRFDGRPEPLRSQGRGHGEFKDILVISMSPGETPDQMVLYSKEQLPPGVKAACVKTPTGHAAEVAIPVSYLNQKQGGDWKAFRMNVTVDDYDAVAGPLRAPWWRADWRHGETYAGSGTFQRK
jgi:hypothetical protein